MATIDAVVDIVGELREDGVPAFFREACLVVDEHTQAVTAPRDSNLDSVRNAFSARLSQPATDGGFVVWALDVLHAISDVVDRLESTSQGEPSPALVHTVRSVQPGTEDWLDRLRIVMKLKTWSQWT